MMHAVVADSERADLAGFLCLDQSFPRAFAGFRSPVGRVDQVEVDIGEFGLREGGFD